MKKLTAAQTKSITNAKDQVKAAANVMIETPLELIKCILLKHETAVIEVMKELHDEKMRLQQQRDELVAAAIAVRADLVRRAEFDSEDGGAVLNISNGVLMQLDAAIAKVKGE